ncbi:MAG: hypothetical protein HZB37_10855 [Planctomycetes bacterium]|nr:hypothetical protein [Planctomycetota bacterium]
MQSMGGGGAPQVAKPVTPPPPPKEQAEKPKPEPEPVKEERKPAVVRPPEPEPVEKKVIVSKLVEPVEKKEKPEAAKPVIPTPEESRSLITLEKRPTVMRELKPQEAKPKDQLNVLTDLRSSIKLDSDYKSPYIKIDKKDPAYKNLFKPFKSVGSALFRDPKKKYAQVEIKKPYFGKVTKGFIYYIAVVQIWLGIAACICIYFFKPKKNR